MIVTPTILADVDRRQLAAERAAHAQTTQLLIAAMAEALRQQTICAELSRQLALANRASVLVVIEHGSLAASCLEAADNQIHREQMQRATIRAQRPSVVHDAYCARKMEWDLSTPDTDVVDEPVVGRATTEQLYGSASAPMIDVIGGVQ